MQKKIKGKYAKKRKKIFLTATIALTSIFLSSCNQKLVTVTANPDTTELSNDSAVMTIENYLKVPDIDYNIYKEQVQVKALYVTGPVAGHNELFPPIFDMSVSSEINALVIDVKNDKGEITFKNVIPAADEIGASINYIRDPRELIKTLTENKIYPIARIVAFKDPYLAEQKPELAIKNADGSIFYEENLAWVNPYDKRVWDYIIEVAKGAADVGFKEIQFDYIRFSTGRNIDKADFGPDSENKSKTDIILEFTKYAVDNLKPLGVDVSADVYGTIIYSKVDADIVGQDYVGMSRLLDYICPMVYPSHYSEGALGIKYPDLDPYNIILKTLQESQKALSAIEDSKCAIVRPWLQAFTLKKNNLHYQTYNKEQIRAQIKAVYDAGLSEWIFWNGKSSYSPEWLEE